MIEVSSPEEAGEDLVDLVAMSVHELRNSVTVVAGMAAVLGEHWDRAEPGQLRDIVDATSRHAERMRARLDDLLVVARLEVGSYVVEPRPVAVRDLLDGLLWTGPGATEDLAIRVDPALSVLADPVRLEQVMANLVANAQRHGAPPVVVDARLLGDGQAAITVRDHGEGITTADVSRLFVAFTPRTEEHAGDTGLGLHIARRLSRVMGGELTYRPACPGAAFTVTLPVAGAEEVRA